MPISAISTPSGSDPGSGSAASGAVMPGQISASTRPRDARTSGSSAGAPWIGQLETEADWVAYAEYLDAVGAQARKAGQTLMVHNHNWEFETSFVDTTAYDVLLG